MIKKLVLILLIIGVVVALFLWQLKPQGKVSNTLSQRSEEYLAGQSQSDNNEWDKVELEESDAPNTRNSVFNVDGCFTFLMLYQLFNQRIEEKCEGYYAFNNPKGSIVAYLREGGVEGMDFRRKNPTTYEETSFEAGGKNFVIFKNKENPYEATAYYTSPEGYGLTFTLKAATAKNLDGDLKKMLESIEVLK